MSTRIYIIEPQGNITAGDNRLVMASNQAEAIRLVTKNVFNCRVATTIEVAEMIGSGTKLEKVEPATAPENQELEGE